MYEHELVYRISFMYDVMWNWSIADGCQWKPVSEHTIEFVKHTHKIMYTSFPQKFSFRSPADYVYRPGSLDIECRIMEEENEKKERKKKVEKKKGKKRERPRRGIRGWFDYFHLRSAISGDS